MTEAIRKKQLRGVIFDLDGVLVSTDLLHYQSWKKLADTLGLAFDENVNHGLRGVPREESLRVIYRHNKQPVPEAGKLTELCGQKNAWYVELVGKMTVADVLPGAWELIEALRGEGMKIGIASASRNCKLVLERTELLPLIDAICDGNTPLPNKPDPATLLLVARNLNVLANECIGVEDAAAGVEAIHRAGMPAVGVGEAAGEAEMRIGAVDELTPAVLREVFDAYRLSRA